MKNILNSISKFISDKYYIIISILFLALIGYDFLLYRFTKYILILVLIEVYNVLKIFNFKFFEHKFFNILPKNKFIYLLFLVITYSMVNMYRINDGITVYFEYPGTSISEAIMVDEVKQNIPNNYDYFDSISIQFATYARTNDAHYKFLLYENDNLLYEELFNAKILEDAKYYTFDFDGVTVNHDNNYSFIIKPVYATSTDCISIFTNPTTGNFNYEVLVTKKIDWFKFIIAAIFILIFFIINYFINTRNLKPERIYMIFAVYFIGVLVLTPSLNTPDEYSHFARAYKLSQANEHLNDKDYFYNNYYYGPDIGCLFYGNPESLLGVSDRGRALSCLSNHENDYREGSIFNRLLHLNPIAHFIPSVGIKIIDIFTNSPLIIFMFGRFMNFIVSFILIYYAIKIINKNKVLILIIVTIPMFIQQMISYSYDSILNASVIYCISFLLSYDKNNKSLFFSKLLFILSLLFIYMIKYIYLLLIIPLLLNKKLFNNRKVTFYIKRTIPFVILFMIVVFFAKCWLSFISVNSGEMYIDNPYTNIIFIKSNPLYIFTLAWNTISRLGWFYIESLFGYFGWFVFKFDFYIYLMYLFVLFVVIHSNIVNNVFNKLQRIISIPTILLLVSAVFGAMYFYWSSYQLDYVDGVQGRYFLPLLPVLLISLIPKNSKLKFDIEEKDIYSFINSILLLTIITILCNVY